MGKKAIEKYQEYLSCHSLLSLATISELGTPQARTLTYASEGTVVYFATGKSSGKVRDISQNSSVAFTVDDPFTEDWSCVQGIQMEGRACILSDAIELQKAMGLLLKKFPQIAKLPAGQDMVIIKVESKVGYFLDNSLGYGYRDRIVID